MSKQPSIRLKSAGGLDVEMFAHSSGSLLYNATLEIGGTTVAFFSALELCEIREGCNSSELWLDNACIDIAADSTDACKQFLQDTADYNKGSKA